MFFHAKIEVLSVWDEHLFLFSLFMPYLACYLKGVVETEVSKDEPLTLNIDKVMSVNFY